MLLRPADFASYMASSARLTTVSVDSSVCPNSVTPMLAVQA
jgi:hypothetical protein